MLCCFELESTYIIHFADEINRCILCLCISAEDVYTTPDAATKLRCTGCSLYMPQSEAEIDPRTQLFLHTLRMSIVHYPLVAQQSILLLPRNTRRINIVKKSMFPKFDQVYRRKYQQLYYQIIKISGDMQFCMNADSLRLLVHSVFRDDLLLSICCFATSLPLYFCLFMDKE